MPTVHVAPTPRHGRDVEDVHDDDGPPSPTWAREKMMMMTNSPLVAESGPSEFDDVSSIMPSSPPTTVVTATTSTSTSTSATQRQSSQSRQRRQNSYRAKQHQQQQHETPRPAEITPRRQGGPTQATAAAALPPPRQPQVHRAPATNGHTGSRLPVAVGSGSDLSRATTDTGSVGGMPRSGSHRSRDVDGDRAREREKTREREREREMKREEEREAYRKEERPDRTTTRGGGGLRSSRLTEVSDLESYGTASYGADESYAPESYTPDKRTRYPLSKPGGCAPLHLRQQFCDIDHPRTEPIGGDEYDNDSAWEKRTKKPSLLARLFGRKPKTGALRPSPSGFLPMSPTDPSADGQWWGWEVRATYQRPVSLSPEAASPTTASTPTAPHVELTIWARAGTPLQHLILWGVPWLQGRRQPKSSGGDVFGTYDGCDRHPDRALGRWGRMAERRAYFEDPMGRADRRGRGRWSARVSVVHEDAAWLQRVEPARLVRMEAANTIEIYDEAHQLCFLLDAHTNQFWVLNDSIPDEQGQWIGDNVWNIFHGYDGEA